MVAESINKKSNIKNYTIFKCYYKQSDNYTRKKKIKVLDHLIFTSSYHDAKLLHTQ